MPTFELSNEAKADLKEIHAYIAEDDLTVADRLIDELSEKLRLLGENPSMGRLRLELGAGLRCFPFRRYLIFYTPIQNGIEINRVLHSARDVESQFEM